MRVSKNLWIVAAGLVACGLVIWFSKSIQAKPRTYEVRPQITIPEYRTDAARAIDAYERLMERYMDLTEMNLFRVGTDVQEVVRKLDSIDGKLKQVSTRLARIEKALGIEQPELSAAKTIQLKTPNKANPKKSSPVP